MRVTISLAFIILLSCNQSADPDFDLLKEEVRKTEMEFCQMASDSGIAAAFEFFAADNAVLLRGDQIIKGKENIARSMESVSSNGGRLVWEPDFVDVSSSGDLAYTYGNFTYSMVSGEGDTLNSKGIFHTVWKRQEDGSWKYVWD
jgi:ketosteroid isomerase-like protein